MPRGVSVFANLHRHRTAVRLRPSGFTLLELITVLSIVGIAVALALPSFREIGVRSTTTTIANDLIAALAQARAEAVKRGVFVAVISSSGSNDWSDGWGVFADSERDQTFATPVVSHSPIPDHYKVRTKGDGTVAGRIVFSGQGELVGAEQFDINVCRPDGNVAQSRHIRVRTSGIVTAHRDTGASSAPSC